MPLQIVTVPCRTDNYAYLLRDEATGTVALVDAPAARAIEAELRGRGWGLDLILITHHHGDHVEGVADLKAGFGAAVVGAGDDRHRLPPLDRAVAEGDTVEVGESVARVMAVPGHTVGHIAYHFAADNALFSADSLMALGCGRLFEGTPEQMWASLSAMAALPPETRVYSGHEYAASNARFAVSVDPDNADLRARAAEIERLRTEGKPTIPVTIATELATNPFLRASDPAIRRAVDLPDADDAQVFAAVRRAKDAF